MTSLIVQRFAPMCHAGEWKCVFDHAFLCAMCKIETEKNENYYPSCLCKARYCMGLSGQRLLYQLGSGLGLVLVLV